MAAFWRRRACLMEACSVVVVIWPAIEDALISIARSIELVGCTDCIMTSPRGGPALLFGRPRFSLRGTIVRHVLNSILGLLVAQLASSAELQNLAADARSILGAEQGVYVEAADGAVLLSQAAAKPVHPAS